jgi:AraC family transcriptional regulator of arabinose operon
MPIELRRKMDINAIDTNLPRIQEGFQGQRSCILPPNKQKLSAAHPFCKKLYITDLGYYPQAAFHNRLRENGANQHILIYCTRGEGWYRINKQRFPVKPNQYFILPKSVPHEYGADIQNPWSIYWVHFSGEESDYFVKYLQGKQSKGPMSTSPSPARVLLFEEMLHHLELMNHTDNIVLANSSLYAFLASFKRVQFKAPDTEKNPVQEIIELMKNNLDRNFTLEELARHVHMSPSRLSALFREKTHYSPISLLTSLKIQKAGQLIKETNQNIKSIARSMGYADPYHFSRVFKNIMGVSPKTFRLKG